MRAWGAPAALLLAASLGACATPGGPPPPAPAPASASAAATPAPAPAAAAPAEAALLRSPIQIFDPLERFNRNVYWFNADFDRAIFLPVVHGYEYVTPVFLQERVSDFFNNLTELRNAMNGLLQARPEVASRAVIRFAVNSTVGLLGTFDVAGDMGVKPQPEDLGLTLGRWGVPAGPYLVLPILGPSNFRDAAGRGGDILAARTVPPAAQINDTVYFSPAVVALFAIDARHQIPFRYYQTGSPFEYDFVRFLYTKSRELRIRNAAGPQPYSAAAGGSTAAGGAAAEGTATAGGEPFGGF